MATKEELESRLAHIEQRLDEVIPALVQIKERAKAVKSLADDKEQAKEAERLQGEIDELLSN